MPVESDLAVGVDEVGGLLFESRGAEGAGTDGRVEVEGVSSEDLDVANSDGGTFGVACTLVINFALSQ